MTVKYIYYIIYNALLLYKYIFVLGLVDINPITCYVKDNVESYLFIEAWFWREILYVIPIIYTIMLGYALYKKVFVRGLYIFAAFSLISIKIITDDADMLFAVMIVMVVLMTFSVSNSGLKISLIRSFLRIVCKKKNLLKVYLVLVVLIALNIIYISMPKNKVYIYMESYNWNSEEYILENDNISEVIPLHAINFYSGGIFTACTVRGWLFKADKPGITNIHISSKDTFHENTSSDETEYKNVQIEVDDNLKIHFDLDKEYIRTFYRLNVYMIFFSVVMFVILTGQCIVKCISAHIGRHGDY